MKRALLVGAGGWGRSKWVRGVLPDFRDRVTVTGMVDIDEEVLRESGEALGVPAEGLFTDMKKAFASVDADFCIIALPPAHHAEAALLAVKKGMDIISEKPISDSQRDVVDVYKAVTKKSRKMAITQNYRYESPILTMKSVLQSGDLGRLNYVVSRYAHDYREPGSWRVDHVHERDNPLMIEATIHHFDMLRNLTGSDCETIMGYGWNPEWSSFKGMCSGMFLMQMQNGTKAFYEGNSLEAGQINPWFRELYRVECEKGTVSVGHEQVVRIHRRDGEGNEITEDVPDIGASVTGHNVIMNAFLNWLDGGEPPETQLEDNIHSTAMLFAAIDAFGNGQVKQVKDYLP